MRYVIFCGSRDWGDPIPIRLILAALENKDVTIVHGAARGADRLAGQLAENYRIAVEEYPADWKGHGKAAGPIRNKLMLDARRPAFVVAFKDGFDHTFSRGGTENMVHIAREADIPTYVISHG